MEIRTGATGDTTWAGGYTCGGTCSPKIPYVYEDYANGLLYKQADQKKEDGMRAVFEVIVVDPKKGTILVDEKVVAKTEDEAKLKVLMGKQLDLESIDIGVESYGHFVRPKKEVQKVKVVKDDE